MALLLSPKELEKSYLYWKDNNKYKYYISFVEIYIIYPMLEFKYYDKKVKRYRYSCKHLKYKGKKAYCSIQKIKPRLCSDYGQENKLTMGQSRAHNQKLYPKCVL